MAESDLAYGDHCVASSLVVEFGKNGIRTEVRYAENGTLVVLIGVANDAKAQLLENADDDLGVPATSDNDDLLHVGDPAIQWIVLFAMS